jgi:Flp pilus assembly pilin Flp
MRDDEMTGSDAPRDRQSGQALIEYTLLLMMVTMVFWVGIKNSDMSRELERAWSRVSDCVEMPAACDSAS